MTGTLRRTGALTAFRLGAPLPRDPITELLAAHRFRSIADASSELDSVGWITQADPSGDTIGDDDVLLGRASWLTMRVDRKRVPPKWLQNELAALAKSRGRALSARERKEARADLVQNLLPRVLPSTAQVDALLTRDQVFVLSSSRAAVEAFARLWFATFGVGLVELGPQALALDLVDRELTAAVEQLQPTRWPLSSRAAEGPAVQGSLGLDTTDGFLGEEFLLWLWFLCENLEGEVVLHDGELAGVAIVDLIEFAALGDDDTVPRLNGGTPTRTPEARAALRRGRRVARLRLLVAVRDQQWTVTIDGPSLRCSGVRLPEDPEDCETAEDRTEHRCSSWADLHRVVRALFREFVCIRLSPDWEDAARRVAAWMRA